MAASASQHPTTTLRRVDTKPRAFADLDEDAPQELLEEARTAADALAGSRVLHINATSYGGGVAELLSSEIGLMVDGGVAAEWHVICPDSRLFAITKKIHNALQGREIRLSDSEWQLYVDHNRHCAAMIGDDWDVVVVHDPQPAALIESQPAPSAKWLWRCHIDTSTPDHEVWEGLRPFVAAYDGSVFTLDSFRPPDIAADDSAVIAPAIDPLSTKNRPLPPDTVQSTVAGFGFDLARPLVCQVSRFDPWKDPLGVIEAWRQAREEVPGLQLALVGSMADDDPEGFEVYAEARATVADEADCRLLTNQQGVGPLEVNAFQRQSDIVVQKSLREGFGLTVAEALWKKTAVIGGNVGGIPVQLGNDEAGILVDDVEGCARAIITLLGDRELRHDKAQAGRERVRREFLIPRLARDDMELYARLLAEDGAPR